LFRFSEFAFEVKGTNKVKHVYFGLQFWVIPLLQSIVIQFYYQVCTRLKDKLNVIVQFIYLCVFCLGE